MPYPNEHAARVKDESGCGKFKRMNQGSGVSLILCEMDGKMEAVSYRFDKQKFTAAQAKEWLSKHNLRADKFEAAVDVKAKLSMKASMPEVDGRIWSAGMHHVYVNDKPARVYVPEETIMQTFDSVRSLINSKGRMPIGIDHLSDTVLKENDILNKLNLLDVGDVTKVGTDGTSIYILESQLTNDNIRTLHKEHELPAFSIVGAMDAKPCPNGKADYVVESIDVERVDFVEEGGCSVCKVGEQPDQLILTSKKVNNEGVDNMTDVNETVVPEATEEKSNDVVVEQEADKKDVEPEKVENVEEVEIPAEELEEPEVKEDEDPAEVSELEAVKKELKELKEMLGGKKPRESSFNAKEEVEKLIKAGNATPKMRDALIEVAEASEEAFKQMAASLPKMVNMKMESKLAQIEEQTKPKKKKPQTWEEKYGEMAKVFRV